MFSIFYKEKQGVVAPVSGHCMRIEEVPDKVFSTKMMGDGFAIIPDDNIISAPIDGTIVMIPDSRHAFGIKNKQGVEILVHVGLDTVNFHGQGFETLVKIGDKVQKDTPILKFDQHFMKQNNANMITMIVFIHGYEDIQLSCYNENVLRGDTVIR